MLVTFYKVDARARRYLERYNATRGSKWIPVVVPCRGRVMCDHLASDVCEWFDKHGYKRITLEDPTLDDLTLDEPEETDIDESA